MSESNPDIVGNVIDHMTYTNGNTISTVPLFLGTKKHHFRTIYEQNDQIKKGWTMRFLMRLGGSDIETASGAVYWQKNFQESQPPLGISAH